MISDPNLYALFENISQLSISEVLFYFGYLAPLGAIIIMLKLDKLSIPEHKLNKKPRHYEPGM